MKCLNHQKTIAEALIFVRFGHVWDVYNWNCLVGQSNTCKNTLCGLGMEVYVDQSAVKYLECRKPFKSKFYVLCQNPRILWFMHESNLCRCRIYSLVKLRVKRTSYYYCF